MRTNKKKQINQRKIVQQKLDQFSKLNSLPPPSGWVKAVRGSLGLSIRQLADRLGVGHGAINQLEKREQKKRVTLDSLEQVAQAMDCKLIYAIVPRESGETLQDIINRRAVEAAKAIVKDVAHTMRLEAQGTPKKQIKMEIQRIASKLIETSDSRIWSTNSKSKSRK